MKYNGFYVNLDRSPDRRAAIEAELYRNGLGGKYQRFAAIDGNALGFPNPALKDSEIGCFSSQYQLLLDNRHTTKPLHIIDDDILLSPIVEVGIDSMIEGDDFQNYDIVHTDVHLVITDGSFLKFRRTYNDIVKRDENGALESVDLNLVDLAGTPFCSTTSLVINPKSIEKIIALYAGELYRGAQSPIDLFIYSLCKMGILKVGCLFPFITTIPFENNFKSTIHNRSDAITMHASQLLRHSFYIKANIKECAADAARILPQPTADDYHAQLILNVLGFSMTKGYGTT